MGKDFTITITITITILLLLFYYYYFTSLCQHLKEIEWMPSSEQVLGCLPAVFKDKYPMSYAIIDGSEIFIEMPSDLRMQSSTWSDYKHHNTLKFLVGCTPNGVVLFVSPLYVGSISDVEITRVSGFISKLPATTTTGSRISIMADRGFTIQDQLNAVGVDLNIPSFLSGRPQLSASEVQHT